MSDENQRIDPALLGDANPAGLNPNDAVNGGMEISGRPRGIKKINKKGIIIGAAIIGAAAIVATTTFNGTSGAAADAARAAATGQSKSKPTDVSKGALWYANMPDKVVAADQAPDAPAPNGPNTAGTVAAPGLPGDPAVPDLTGKAVNPMMAATAGKTSAVAYRPGAAGAAGAAPGAAPAPPPTPAEQQAAMLEKQRQQDMDSAMKSTLAAPGFGEKNQNQPQPNPTAAALAALGARAGGSPVPFGMPAPREDDPNKQERKDSFLKGQRDATDTDYSPSAKNAARSQYEVKAGSIIPAVMIGGINSDLPGQVIAQVKDNVYDSKTGQYLLIPQGSRLVGLYDSHVAYGQRRILLAWNRIIYPDGSSFNLKGMPGADKSGYAGFSDQVDNHYLRIFGSAALMSLISAGVQLSQPANSGSGNNSNTPSVSQTVGAALGQQIGQTAMSITQKNLAIQPTLEVRPGYLFNVMVTADMILPPASK